MCELCGASLKDAAWNASGIFMNPESEVAKQPLTVPFLRLDDCWGAWVYFSKIALNRWKYISVSAG